MMTLSLKKNGKTVYEIEVFEEISIKEEMRILDGFQRLSKDHKWIGKENTHPCPETNYIMEESDPSKINYKKVKNKSNGLKMNKTKGKEVGQ